MAGRPRIYETDELIDRAIDVFWTKGYEAASAKDLLAALQIGQGSFYNTFQGGKRELFEKCLRRFSDEAAEQFQTNLQKADDPIEYLKRFFLAVANSPREQKLKGCLLCNTIVELTSIDSGLKNMAAKLLARLEESFRTIIEQAQQKGRLENRTSPEVLAKHLINLWNGINITQRLNPNDKTMKAVIEMNLEPLN